MAKIFSILTLLVALGATFLGFQSKTLVEKLKIAADKEHTDLGRTREDLKKTKDTLKTTQDELATTKTELETTKGTLRTTEAELTTKKSELETTKTMLAEKEQKIVEYEKLIASMPKPEAGKGLKEQIEEMQKTTADLKTQVQNLEKEKAEKETVIDGLNAKTKELEGRIAPLNAKIRKFEVGIIQEGLRGRVLAVNAGWGFCVLSLGDKQGAAANRILVVARGGQAIGKVKITSVETSQSVADIVSGSFAPGMYVQPGDEVIYLKGAEKPKAEEGENPAPQPGAAAPPAGPELPIRN